MRRSATRPAWADEPKQLAAQEPAHRVRVNPGEMVMIAATFDGFTGRYMYHRHILQYEDHDMMRPFIVMPIAALAAMNMPEA
jgi:FtsP/CotA-like multicopper oxidase with cupredoxin domain